MKKLFFVALILCPVSFAQTNVARMLSGVNAQTGTSYTFVASDVSKVVTFNNLSPVSVSLVSGANQGFGAGSVFTAVNLGAGVVTIVCSGCTINGSASIQVVQNQSVSLYGDGANYVSASGSGAGAANFASPPPLGNTTPNTVAGTVVNIVGSGLFFSAQPTCLFGESDNTLDEFEDVGGIPMWLPQGALGPCSQFLTYTPLPVGINPTDKQVPAWNAATGAFTIQTQVGGGGSPGGSNGQIQYNNAGAFGGYTMSGDCTLVPATGVITCTKTSGSAFAPSATTDATIATNIASGTLNAARLPATAVLTNQANTFSTGLQSMAAADYLQPVHVTDPATCTAGQIEFNSTGAVMKFCSALNTWTALGTSGGSVTTFSAGTLSPLFTTSVANATTTPALSFTLSNAAANTIFANFTAGSAAPSFSTINGGVSCGDATHALSYTNGTGFGCQAVGSGSVVWSAIGNPAGNLALTMAANTSTFNTTTAVSQFFKWANTTAAVIGASQSSPILSLCGTEFHAAASAEGCLAWQFIPGTGTDAANTIALTHTGSATGATTTTFPGPIQAGSPGGAGGTITLPEGTTATASTGNDVCYGDSTAHAVKCAYNNGTFQIVPLISSTSTTVTQVLHATATAGVFAPGAIVVADLPVAIPIGNIGSAGLSGTAPVAISAAGAISVSAIPLTSLATQAANTVTANVTAGSATPTAAAIPSGLQNYVAGTGYNEATSHQVGAALVCADSSASGTAQSCTTSPSFTPAANDCVIYTTTTANTGAGLTLNVNALGAKSVAKWQGTTTLAANDVLANKQVVTCYDGTNWELSTIGNVPAGGGGTTTNALTMNNGGAGAVSGSTFNGSGAVTLSYNTIGAAASNASTAVNGQTCALGSTCTVNPPLDKSANGLANPTADATFTQPIGSTVGITLNGTAPASVATATGTNGSSILVVTAPTGGADSNATGTAGIGGSPAITAGAGGAGTGTNAVGGAGGSVTLTGGNGGASLGTGVNANGGNVVVLPGTAGSGGSGTAGKAGVFQVGSSAPFPIVGTAGGSMFGCGTAPTGIAANGTFYCNASNFVDLMTGVTDLGPAVAEASIIGANVMPKAIGTNPGLAASSITDGATTGLTSSTNFLKGANTQRLTANATAITATTPGTTVFTFGALPVSTNFSFHCAILYNQQTAAAAGTGFAVQGATNAPTRLDAWAQMYTSNAGVSAGGSLQNLTTTTATSIVTGTPSAITTVFQTVIDGSVQVGASATTLNILAFTGNASDSITIQAGSYCTVTP